MSFLRYPPKMPAVLLVSLSATKNEVPSKNDPPTWSN